MSVAALVGSFDDIVRSASVLTEGIEGGKSTVEPPFFQTTSKLNIKTLKSVDTFGNFSLSFKAIDAFW